MNYHATYNLPHYSIIWYKNKLDDVRQATKVIVKSMLYNIGNTTSKTLNLLSSELMLKEKFTKDTYVQVFLGLSETPGYLSFKMNL